MLWSENWRDLSRWSERLSWWQQLVLLPPTVPIAMLLAGVCLCPRTVCFSAAVLVVVYIPLVRSGVFALSWNELGAGAGAAYLCLVAICYLAHLQEGLKHVFKRRGDQVDPESANETPS